MAKKGKLPKKVGGVKLGKDLRKAGARLLKIADSPVGRDLLLTGIGLAAAAATAAVERKRGDRAGPDGAAKPAAKDPHEIGVQLGKMAEAAIAGLFAPKKG